MKKLMFFVLMSLIATSAVAAKFDAGLKLRFRSELETVRSTYNSDTQAYNRYADLRFRPWFSYEINEYLKAKMDLEIGDFYFGDQSGKSVTDVGTDGIAIEVQHLFLDIMPDNMNTIRIGTQAIADSHALIIDDDVAGLSYFGTFESANVSAGLYALQDYEAFNENETSYNPGELMLYVDGTFNIDEKMNAGLSFFSTFEGKKDSLYYNSNTQMWIAPHFDGDFGVMDVSAQFVYDMRMGSVEKLNDSAPDQDDPDNESSMAFSLKTNIKAVENLNIGVNFLFINGDEEGADVYQGVSACYANGLQILSDDAINGKSLVSIWEKSGYGIMLPSLTVDYTVNEDVKVGGGFGMAMTLEDVAYNNGADESTNLGMEFGVRGEVKMFEKLTLLPYASFLIPGEALTESDDTDMQMKVGAVLKTSF